MKRTYSYDPSNITAYGKDRMRFELGDTLVEGEEATCALCDEEYAAVLSVKIWRVRQWKKAKLACIESIFRRFSYEVDTKTGPLSLEFNERAKLWQDEYKRLKDELEGEALSPLPINMLTVPCGVGRPTRPYFYNGMQSTEETEGQDI